jgi:hypothetical protein
MKTYKSFLLLFVLAISLSTGAQNLATTIKIQAMDMGDALLKNDFNRFVKYMHPGIVSFAGGKENMKTKMDTAYSFMNQFGAKVKKYWIGHPSGIVKHKNQLQAVLPQSTTVSTPLGDVVVETSMIVISPDNGKNWWFIDTNVYQEEKLRKMLPDLSPKLVIPARKKPKIIPAKDVKDRQS